MSSENSHSIYGSNSISDISGIDQSKSYTGNGKSEIVSSDSSLNLSDSESMTKPEIPIKDTKYHSMAKTESIKSIWSALDMTSKSCSDSSSSESYDCDEKNTKPFVFDGRVIRYNLKHHLDYNTPVVFGSSKASGHKEKHGYNPSHFVFDPKTGSAAFGYEVNGGWKNLANYSLITGLGNSCKLDAGFISGANNSIDLELLDNLNKSKKNNKNGYCLLPPACAIIGGNHNNITNTSSCHYSSAIIASSNVKLRNCEETVVLGVKFTSDEKPLEGLKETAVVRNINVLNNASVNGDLFVDGTIDANNIQQNSYVVIGATGGDNITISPQDGINVVYADATQGDVGVMLGNTGDVFESNRVITIKDATLEFSMGTSHNVFIGVPQGTRIETYLPMGNGTDNNGYVGLTAADGGIYKLNSSGGSVTFRYFNQNPIPGALPTWVIESQFIGNPRLLGMSFVSSDKEIRAKLLNH